MKVGKLRELPTHGLWYTTNSKNEGRKIKRTIDSQMTVNDRDYTYVSNDSDCKCNVLSCSFKRYRTIETDELIYRLLLLLRKSKANEYLTGL